MTREELIKEIAKRVKDIRKLYYSVYPEGNHLDMTIRKDSIDFHNSYYKEDKNFQVDYYEDEECISINRVWEDKW